MWNRLFGKPKAEKPAATLDDASKSVDERGGKVDDKLKKMDAELLGYKVCYANATLHRCSAAHCRLSGAEHACVLCCVV